jgi:pSer/pThr/pTyr-binding forkhead associated (FHA) protein
MPSLPPPVAALTARLVCRLRPGVTERFVVQGSEVVLGREPGLAVTVPLDGVSRRHAKITFDGKAYRISNLSPAGTFLNGNLVVSERLAHLDVITLGKKVDILFLLRAEEGPTATEGIVRAALVPEGADATPHEIALGEILIGRSSANNVVAEESGAVSKVHARIERSPQQLVLRDLGSSNGTYVNGERVMTALLRDGDVISLANVISYRVLIERGEVLSGTAPGLPANEVRAAEIADQRTQFSPEWKTRYDWDSAEIRDIAAMQARLIAEDGARKRARARLATTDKPAAKVAPKPAAPRPAAPRTSGATVKVPPPPAAAVPAPPVVAAIPPSPPPAAGDPPVVELRLTGPAGDLVVTAPGEYSLGRAKDAALRVDNPTVSRRHALIVLSTDGKAFVDHGGGANGTRLNGATVDKRSPLRDGDRVSIGEVELLVRLKSAAGT